MSPIRGVNVRTQMSQAVPAGTPSSSLRRGPPFACVPRGKAHTDPPPVPARTSPLSRPLRDPVLPSRAGFLLPGRCPRPTGVSQLGPRGHLASPPPPSPTPIRHLPQARGQTSGGSSAASESRHSDGRHDPRRPCPLGAFWPGLHHAVGDSGRRLHGDDPAVSGWRANNLRWWNLPHLDFVPPPLARRHRLCSLAKCS